MSKNNTNLLTDMVNYALYTDEKYGGVVDILVEVANKSESNKRKVGAFIYNSIFNKIVVGYNHLECEFIPEGFPKDIECADNITNPFVIHAEENALYKYQNSLIDGTLSYIKNETIYDVKRDDFNNITDEYHTLFTTFSPCYECAKMLANSLIKHIVVFNVKEEYFLSNGYDKNKQLQYQSILIYLIKSGIKVTFVTNCERINIEKYK